MLLMGALIFQLFIPRVHAGEPHVASDSALTSPGEDDRLRFQASPRRPVESVAPGRPKLGATSTLAVPPKEKCTKAEEALGKCQRIGDRAYTYGADFPCHESFLLCQQQGMWWEPANFSSGELTYYPSTTRVDDRTQCEKHYTACVQRYAHLPKNSCHDFAYSFCREMKKAGAEAVWVAYWNNGLAPSPRYHTQNIVRVDSKPPKLCLVEPQWVRTQATFPKESCWPEAYDKKTGLPQLPPGTNFMGMSGTVLECDDNFFKKLGEKPGHYVALEIAERKKDGLELRALRGKASQ